MLLELPTAESLLDLPEVDPALVVDHLEEGFVGLPDDAVRRRRPAVGHDIARLDFSVARARIISLLSNCRIRQEGRERENHCCGMSEAVMHDCALLGLDCISQRKA